MTGIGRPALVCETSKIAARMASRDVEEYSNGGLPSVHSIPSFCGSSIKRTNAEIDPKENLSETSYVRTYLSNKTVYSITRQAACMDVGMLRLSEPADGGSFLALCVQPAASIAGWQPFRMHRSQAASRSWRPQIRRWVSGLASSPFPVLSPQRLAATHEVSRFHAHPLDTTARIRPYPSHMNRRHLLPHR